MTGDHIGSRLCAAFLPLGVGATTLRRSSGRCTRCWRALALGYVIVEVLGVEWEWLDGWGVDGFEIVVSALCVLQGAAMRRGRASPSLLGVGLLLLGRRRHRPDRPVARRTRPAVALAGRRLLRGLLPGHLLALMLLLRSHVKRFSLASWLDGGGRRVRRGRAVRRRSRSTSVLHHAGGNIARRRRQPCLSGRRRPPPQLVVGGAAIVSGRRRLPWLLLAAGYALITAGDIFNLLGSASFVGRLPTRSPGRCRSCSCRSPSGSSRRPPRPPVADEPPGFVLPALAAGAALAILFVGSLEPRRPGVAGPRRRDADRRRRALGRCPCSACARSPSSASASRSPTS